MSEAAPSMPRAAVPAEADRAEVDREEPEGTLLAQAVLAALIRAGVREVVVCAGARNAALVAVVAITPSLRHWSFPEERCAGFFALGRARALESPVAVLTTSGTAVAELLPAVIEAYYQSLPLVLVTADRPRAFRGTGAPQAIEQPGLFSTYVAACGDLATREELAAFEPALATWDRRVPIHLNICFNEPSAHELARAQEAEAVARPAPAPRRASATAVEEFLADTAAGPLVAVVAALPVVEQAPVAGFLQRLDCPVVAEATSGLREWAALASQRVFAGESELASLPAGRVLRIGGVPSSRWWRDLEKRPAVRVLSLTPSGFPGLARPSDVGGLPDWDQISILSQPTFAPAETARFALGLPPAVVRTLEVFPRSEPSWVHALSLAIPSGSLVFLGNSLPIREWNVFATDAHRSLRCHANRGANGIDGCVSTFLGMGADEPESWAVIGDLTALYDLAALWVSPSLPAARRRLVIINNGGGRIFSRVAALRDLPDPPRRLMENPHTLDFRPWAELFGWAYARVSIPEDLAHASQRPEPHLVIEIIPDPAETHSVWSWLAQATGLADSASVPIPPA